jgi:hypothetical protein
VRVCAGAGVCVCVCVCMCVCVCVCSSVHEIEGNVGEEAAAYMKALAGICKSLRYTPKGFPETPSLQLRISRGQLPRQQLSYSGQLRRQPFHPQKPVT